MHCFIWEDIGGGGLEEWFLLHAIYLFSYWLFNHGVQVSFVWLLWQKDNVSNQREHVVSLLANEQSRLRIPEELEPVGFSVLHCISDGTYLNYGMNFVQLDVNGCLWNNVFFYHGSFTFIVSFLAVCCLEYYDYWFPDLLKFYFPLA